MNQNPLLKTLDLLNALKQEFFEALPNLILGISMLIIGIAFAYLLRWFCEHILVRSFKILPRAIRNTGFVSNYLEPLAKGLSKMLFFAVILVSLATSLKKMGLDLASGWLSGLAQYLPNAIAAVIIVFLGWRVKELLEEVLDAAFRRSEVSYSGVLSRSIAWTVFVLSALVALGQVGIDLNFLIIIVSILLGAFLFSLALMLALGAKEVLSNALHCHQLSKLVRPGDRVKTAEVRGTVLSIGPTYVVIDGEQGRVALPGAHFHQHALTFIGDEAERGD